VRSLLRLSATAAAAAGAATAVWVWQFTHRRDILATGQRAVDQIRLVGLGVVITVLVIAVSALASPTSRSLAVTCGGWLVTTTLLGAVRQFPAAPRPLCLMAWAMAVPTLVALVCAVHPPPLTRGVARWDPVVLSAAVWTVFVLAACIAPLLPVASTYDALRRSPRPWVIIATENGPLVATIAVLATLLWTTCTTRRLGARSTTATLTGRDPLTAVQADVAAWLADPTLAIAYPTPTGSFVTTESDSPPSAERSGTIVSFEGVPIAQILHDPALTDDPALITAAAIAAVAIDANRLLALVQADVHAAQRLTERLLEVDRTTAGALLEVLEHGPLRTLDEAAGQLTYGAPISAIVGELQAATAAVRGVSHGFLPPELATGGLRAALSDRAGVPRRRFAAAIEVTLYLCAVDDPAATFEDHDNMVVVHRSTPLVDPSVVDRVEVLGGWVRADSVLLEVDG
jgi:hypothetical protein